MKYRNFVRAPRENFVPNTRVKGSFVRTPVMALAFEKAGVVIDQSDLQLEAAIRVPA